MKRTTTILASLLTLSVAAPAAIFDDFNDGNDTAPPWTRQSPLAGFGAGAQFTFPNGNSYQISSPASPNPVALGPARAGSLRLDESYTSFLQSVDIVNWDSSQTGLTIGMLARVGPLPGLGSTDGYSLTITLSGTLEIYRVTDEIPVSLVAVAPTIGMLNTATDYRLVFTGDGSALTGQIFDIANLATPLATAVGSDAAYASGTAGVLIYTSDDAQTATATFDNYASAIPEPGSLLLLAGGAGLALISRRRRAA